MVTATAGRRGLASLAVLALAGFMVSGYGTRPQPARSAADARGHLTRATLTASPQRPGLHATATIALGAAAAFLNPGKFAEAPDGTVFYARNSKVFAVHGGSSPVIAEHAGHRVLALAASSSRLFVQTGLTVTAYSRSSGKRLRRWRLHSSVAPLTSAGLLAVGRTLWSWTDWATDSSGFEFASVNRIRVNSATVHVVARDNVYPGDMDADSAGLYFQAVRGIHVTGNLAHAGPFGGATRFRRQVNVDAPVALGDGRIVVLAVHRSGRAYVDSYSPVTLKRLASKQVSTSYRDVTHTGAGLLILKEPCAAVACATASVAVLNPAAGSVTGTLGVPHAELLLEGPSAAVIVVTGGHAFLVRLAA